ncbi:MAG: DUF1538 domain-containing protein [Firmicutes bacterium]|nr:DUF1538 domain-containing protein [Bacillota bacterium]
MLQETKDIFKEIGQSVTPIIALITLLLLILRMPAQIIWQFLGGALLFTLGLFLFLIGIRVGLLPLGEAVGAALAEKGSLPILIGTAFVLGLTVTVAEPNTRVLSHYVEIASQGRVGATTLIAAVALGVAIFVAMALLRIFLNIPLSFLLGAGCAIILFILIFTPAQFAAVSYDAGGVITGPLLVPFVLALGIGIASVLGGKSVLEDGFGLIGLAFFGPIIGVLLLGVFLS